MEQSQVPTREDEDSDKELPSVSQLSRQSTPHVASTELPEGEALGLQSSLNT